MTADHAASVEQKKRVKHEGPKKHIIAYIFSLVLTILAFAVVISGDVNIDFVYIMLVLMAGVQVFIQMAFWMHMKDRGHLFPIVGILSGVVIVFTMIIMAVYWAWW
jgi:Heme/copper-type cytochrome/quinol oxidase, subunit 4